MLTAPFYAFVNKIVAVVAVSAFDGYFRNKRYLDMITQKFSCDTRASVEQMTKQTLRRQIIENMTPVGTD
jgi:hypothetical protein